MARRAEQLRQRLTKAKQFSEGTQKAFNSAEEVLNQLEDRDKRRAEREAHKTGRSS
jgi:hypothetical protein